MVVDVGSDVASSKQGTKTAAHSLPSTLGFSQPQPATSALQSDLVSTQSLRLGIHQNSQKPLQPGGCVVGGGGCVSQGVFTVSQLDVPLLVG